MNRISAQRKTLGALQRSPGQLKIQHSNKGTSVMEPTPKPMPKQTRKQRIVHFPNKGQFAELPSSAKRLCREYALSPQHAKLVAELQNYKMGGAV